MSLVVGPQRPFTATRRKKPKQMTTLQKSKLGKSCVRTLPVVLVLFASGCGIVTPQKQSHSELLSRSSPQSHREFTDKDLQVSNLRVDQNDQTGELLVSGTCVYRFKRNEWTTWSETWQHTSYGAYNIPFSSTGTQQKKSEISTSPGRVVPSELDIVIQLGSGQVTAKTQPDSATGDFTARLTSDGFRRPGRLPSSYHLAKYRTVGMSVGIRSLPASGGDHGYLPTFRSDPMLKEFLVEPDWDKVKGFVQTRTPTVYLSVQDKVTRLPVSANIRITGSQVATRDDLKRMFSDEFRDDRVVDQAMTWAPSFLEQGEKREENAQSLSFVAASGSTYRLETTHGKYYYFSGFLKAEPAPKIEKLILLIEKGAKLRVENVKEGEGGELVDP